jgi:hypothetical protein
MLNAIVAIKRAANTPRCVRARPRTAGARQKFRSLRSLMRLTPAQIVFLSDFADHFLHALALLREPKGGQGLEPSGKRLGS